MRLKHPYPFYGARYRLAITIGSARALVMARSLSGDFRLHPTGGDYRRQVESSHPTRHSPNMVPTEETNSATGEVPGVTAPQPLGQADTEQTSMATPPAVAGATEQGPAVAPTPQLEALGDQGLSIFARRSSAIEAATEFWHRYHFTPPNNWQPIPLLADVRSFQDRILVGGRTLVPGAD